MKNSEKYKEKILAKIEDGHTIKEAVILSIEGRNATEMSEKDCFEWLNENVPLLTDEEKRFLVEFCKPYASEYCYISVTKREQPYLEDYHYLEVMFESSGGNFYVELPPMYGNEYFSGLDLDKEYSLEELGLYNKVYKERS